MSQKSVILNIFSSLQMECQNRINAGNSHTKIIFNIYTNNTNCANILINWYVVIKRNGTRSRIIVQDVLNKYNKNHIKKYIKNMIN